MTQSIFACVEKKPDDPILGLNEAFKTDPRENKVNLSIGVYCTEEGNIPLLNVVALTEQKLLDKKEAHAYIPISGLPQYCSGVQKLLFGEGSEVIASKRATTIQSLGGTGALKLGADFLSTILDNPTAVVSAPTWQNHVAIFESAGFTVGSYAYYNKEQGCIDFPAMVASLEGLKENTVVILHACCHNPTGFDLTTEEWAKVIEICKTRKLIPFLDIAYQGFGNGLEEDTEAVRLFAKSGLQFFVSSSFSKNFSLYGERVGALTAVCADEAEAARVLTNLKSAARANYSNPPKHGAAIVATVLNDPQLLAQWHEDLRQMRVRIKEMRTALVKALKEIGASKDFSFIEKQNGMFSFTGLTADQVQRLKDEFGVYAVKSGRICVASLNTKNVEYTAKAIKEVIK
ncbi:MAG: aspartate/tyrosine/aromatic aminotransferase [Burkholderiaceae bacterium]|nr:aspartate/tyrosine/aromatic aminotransferase [Burkholderiaceae bacterium]